MTREQEAHLDRIKAAFLEEVDAKYRAGVREHGGNLWDNPPEWLLDEAMKECIDQYTYLFSLKEKLYGRAPAAHSSGAPTGTGRTEERECLSSCGAALG
jgi:hypothetical protein